MIIMCSSASPKYMVLKTIRSSITIISSSISFSYLSHATRHKYHSSWPTGEIYDIACRMSATCAWLAFEIVLNDIASHHRYHLFPHVRESHFRHVIIQFVQFTLIVFIYNYFNNFYSGNALLSWYLRRNNNFVNTIGCILYHDVYLTKYQCIIEGSEPQN